jgi:hypothetical protein
MRALVGHDGWFVPALFAHEALGETVFDRTILLGPGSNVQPRDLTIFTDPEAVLLAYGQPLGPYVGYLSGRRVFAALDDRYDALHVNPASPQNEQWFVGHEAFQVAKLWADAVALERALEGAAERGFPHAAMRAYGGFTILVAKADRTPVLAPLADGASHCALAFTAPDRCQAYVAKLPPETQSAVEGATLDGATLFGYLTQMSVAGLVVDGDEPETTVFVPRAEFDAILGARTD